MTPGHGGSGGVDMAETLVVNSEKFVDPAPVPRYLRKTDERV